LRRWAGILLCINKKHPILIMQLANSAKCGVRLHTITEIKKAYITVSLDFIGGPRGLEPRTKGL
jgi:hypothetical protein